MGPLMVRCIGYALAALLSFVWGAKMQPIEKQREGQGLALRWLPFSYFTRQPTKKTVLLVGRGFEKRREQGENVRDNICLLFRPSNWAKKIIKIKYSVALDGRQMTNQHYNQPKTCGRNQWGIGEEVWPGGSTGEAYFHHFGGDRVGSRLKTKIKLINLLLIFLCQFT